MTNPALKTIIRFACLVLALMPLLTHKPALAQVTDEYTQKEIEQYKNLQNFKDNNLWVMNANFLRYGNANEQKICWKDTLPLFRKKLSDRLGHIQRNKTPAVREVSMTFLKLGSTQQGGLRKVSVLSMVEDIPSATEFVFELSDRSVIRVKGHTPAQVYNVLLEKGIRLNVFDSVLDCDALYPTVAQQKKEDALVTKAASPKGSRSLKPAIWSPAAKAN